MSAKVFHRTICNRDCPDACGIVAEVEDGVVRAIKGDPDHPVTRGYLCFRTSRFPERQAAPDRLTQPLLRRAGKLEAVSWEEALDTAARRLGSIRAESGPEAVFHYRSGGSLGLLKGVADRFFEAFGPVTIKSGDICSGAGEEAQLLDFGVSDSNALEDLLNAQTIILWGKNPFASNTHLIPVLKEARARGARLILIDPVRHKAAGLCEDYLPLRPGGDLELALGIARALLDQDGWDDGVAEFCDGLEGYRELVQRREVPAWAAAAGVETKDIEALAAAFAAGPTAILVGWGMQRRARGGAIVRALDALSAVSGNLFCPGGGCSFYFARRSAFDSLHEGSAARHVREPLFALDVPALQDPPIRAIWVTAGNPVCMLPDSAGVAKALEDTEFVVVVDPFLTDTGRRADLVLPVPTLLEDDDLLGSYGHHYLGESRPVVPPPDGVRHEVEIFQELARRLRVDAGIEGSIESLKRRMMTRLEAAGMRLEDLRAGARQNPFARQVLFAEGKVRTPNGRVQLLQPGNLELLQEMDAGDGEDRGLWLFSNSTEKSQASQWAGKGLGEHTWVCAHPDAVPGLAEGDLVRVRSASGSLQARLTLDDKQRKDLAIMPKGGHFDTGQSANALIAAAPTDIGLGAAYLDCRVQIEAWD